MGRWVARKPAARVAYWGSSQTLKYVIKAGKENKYTRVCVNDRGSVCNIINQNEMCIDLLHFSICIIIMIILIFISKMILHKSNSVNHLILP